MTPEVPTKVRLDRWLWAARFFKTRSLATQAVTGGRVHVNGDRVKPARAVQTGDTLSINTGETKFVVQVLSVAEKRGPAKIARTLYQETEESIVAREKATELKKLQGNGAVVHAPVQRPGKRDRRKIRSFTRKE